MDLRDEVYGTYGQNRPAAGESTQTVAQAAGGQLRVDRIFQQRYTGYVLAGVGTDHVKSVELSETGEAGATIIWVDTGDGGEQGWKTYLRTDLGFRVMEERRYQYFPTKQNEPDVTLSAPRAGLAFKYAVSKDVLFSEDAEILPNVIGESRVLANSITKISTRLSRSLALGVSFVVNHDSSPAPNKVQTDTTLALSLEVLL